MSVISKRRIKKSVLSLTSYGETTNTLKQLSENISPAAKLEQAIFGVGASLQKRLAAQTQAVNAAMEDSAVRSHKDALWAEFRKARQAQLDELYA